MAQRKPTSITVYWDNQDRGNEGWAYRCSDQDGDIESGALESETLEHAIASACWILDMTGIEQDFAIGQEDGGYAIWTADASIEAAQ